MARHRFHHYTAWDGGGRVQVRGEAGGTQPYQLSSKYEHADDQIYNHDGYHSYPDNIYNSGTSAYRYYGVAAANDSGVSSPALLRRIYNRAPVEHRRSFPDNSQVQHLLDNYIEHGGDVRQGGGGSTSGYSSSSNYEYGINMKTPLHQKSSEFPAQLSTPKPRSILRNSHNQSHLGRDRATSPLFGSHSEILHFSGSTKKPAGDLRQWQQQHQEELLHQHIETQVSHVYYEVTSHIEI